MSFLQNLNWRFATKKFDPDKEVSAQDLEKILTAIRLAPTSFGLQPLHIYVITDKDLKNKLKVVSFSQPQVTDASCLLVFCARTDVKKRIAEYIELTRAGGEKNEGKLEDQRKMMEASMDKKNSEEILEWAARQAYIALGFALVACAELKIDSCPMGGFDSYRVDEILQLPEYMKSVVYLAVGLRAEPPKRPKIRFSQKDLFTFR